MSGFTTDLAYYKIKQLEEELQNLREKNKQLNNDNTALQHTVDDFVVKCKDLQSAYDKEHSRWVELAENYDRLETKYRRLERENEDLKAKKDNVLAFYRIKQLEETNERLKSQLMETNDTLKKANRDRNDLLRQLDLKQKLEGAKGVCKNYYDQGQTDLWVKLQDVKDMQLNEFDVECECLGDVLDMDLEDFLDAYEKWWEEKEEKTDDEVPCSFNWKLDGTEFTIETSIPRADYDNIVKIISGKE